MAEGGGEDLRLPGGGGGGREGGKVESRDGTGDSGRVRSGKKVRVMCCSHLVAHRVECGVIRSLLHILHILLVG